MTLSSSRSRFVAAASPLAVATMLISNPAWAQQTEAASVAVTGAASQDTAAATQDAGANPAPSADDNAIVVTGFRASLQNAVSLFAAPLAQTARLVEALRQKAEQDPSVLAGGAGTPETPVVDEAPVAEETSDAATDEAATDSASEPVAEPTETDATETEATPAEAPAE